MARGELDAEGVVRMLIESIEQTNEHHGMQKERDEKNYQYERKRIQMQLDEKERSFRSTYESKEQLKEELIKLQEKYEFVWGIFTEGFSMKEFAEIQEKIKEFEKE